ncbi:CD5 antigen-like [Sander lucioperca]|uniref:CD5 antigen-like n=1 Tax=Sander lucioperca TaxID=283035 RepID=UPI001653945F|nr:CD5 antigen-like [Sander lucioperca]
MDHLLVLVLLCSSGLQAEGELTSTESVRLVGGDNCCAGTLEVKHQGEWRAVEGHSAWTLKTVDFVCRKLACGSAVSVGESEEPSCRPMWRIPYECVPNASDLRKCASSISHSTLLTLNCPW